MVDGKSVCVLTCSMVHLPADGETAESGAHLLRQSGREADSCAYLLT